MKFNFFVKVNFFFILEILRGFFDIDILYFIVMYKI